MRHFVTLFILSYAQPLYRFLNNITAAHSNCSLEQISSTINIKSKIPPVKIIRFLESAAIR